MAPLNIKLIHCGNRNIANPGFNSERSLFYIPMGLFSMASNLKKAGFDVEILNLDLEKGDIEDILDFRSLDAVGLDCHWINQGLVVLDTARLIKKIKPEVFVFLGGYTASFFAEELLKDYPAVDAVIKGDGDTPIVELCKILTRDYKQENNLESVPNLAWKRSDGQIVFNECSYVATAADMDQFDFADMKLLRNWENYRDLSRFWTKFTSINRLPIFFLEPGRGCKYNCSFCGGSSFAQEAISNRKDQVVRSIDTVISTIKKAVSYGYTAFFTTFEFEGSDGWYSNLFRRIKAEKLKLSFGYGCWSTPSKFLIDELSECFEQVILELSPETFDHDLRKRNKDKRIFYTNKEMEDCLDYINTRANIKVQLYFGYFLPFDNEEIIYKTMEYIVGLYLKYSDLIEIIYSNLSTDPGALLYLNPEKYRVNIAVRNFNDFIENQRENCTRKENSPLNMILFKPDNIPDKKISDLTKKVMLFNRLIYYFGNSILLLLKKSGRTSIISDSIKKLDLSFLTGELTINRVKDILLDILQKHIILNSKILASINEDYRNAAGLKGNLMI